MIFVQVDAALASDRSVSPSDWVAIVHQELRQSGRNLTDITKLKLLLIPSCHHV